MNHCNKANISCQGVTTNVFLRDYIYILCTDKTNEISNIYQSSYTHYFGSTWDVTIYQNYICDKIILFESYLWCNFF